MKLRAIPPLLGCSALLAAGCGGGQSPEAEDEAGPPSELVREAARATLEEPTAGMLVATSSPGRGSFEASGLIDLAGGRFRVEAEADPEMPGLDPPEAVVGTAGEGFEETVAVQDEGFGRVDGPCWFNPHAPVGSFLGTVSVEESVRLMGSVIESLAGGELASATEGDDGTYLVRLQSSAGTPRDDFEDEKARTWGDRALLADLGGPIGVTVADGRIEGVRLDIPRYLPFEGTLPDPEPVRDTSIELSLALSDEALEIEQPECFAIE